MSPKTKVFDAADPLLGALQGMLMEVGARRAFLLPAVPGYKKFFCEHSNGCSKPVPWVCHLQLEAMQGQEDSEARAQLEALRAVMGLSASHSPGGVSAVGGGDPAGVAAAAVSGVDEELQLAAMLDRWVPWRCCRVHPAAVSPR